MRATSSRLNHEQQVKVVIRLKPEESELSYNRCVWLSQQQNHLVVSTDHKKDVFVFDHVAHQATSQLQIYRMIGQEAVTSSLEGYNCCIFAYGQTGAGKTYSIMGDVTELTCDSYASSRGILPRLLEELFEESAQQTTSSFKITCSYIEIYNEQIFDLLSSDKRVHQIREDHRKGVFVEGVLELKLNSYKQGIEALLEGDKTRKMAYTTMNAESSRSHVIFTLLIESEAKDDELIKVKKSKLNIVDLAGSERVKHTNVEGERLREGCNINKSLHVLGNVINSLVESTKKKKHIPYRDSKLTYYLKDSLGGNSITKLLANVHCGKEYYGDTISTLMFAKRAKILKTRVELNENLTENFDSLRKEVRRLREELAEAKYFKDIQKTERTSFYQDLEQTLQKVTDNSEEQVQPKLEILQVFEQNELHYKSLMEVYEEHIRACQNQLTRRNSLNMVAERKNNEKKHIALTKLLRHFPTFTNIYKENLLLKQDRERDRERDKEKEKEKEQPKDRDRERDKHKHADKEKEKRMVEELTNAVAKEYSQKQPQITRLAFKQAQTSLPTVAGAEQLVKIYEQMVDDMKTRFSAAITELQKCYIQLQQQSKIKDRRIKQLIKAQDVPPDIQELRNQNQYLHLNILNLQNQIEQLREQESRLTDRRQSKKSLHRSSLKDKDNNDHDEDTITYVLQQLAVIKAEGEREAHLAQTEREEMQRVINELRVQVSSLLNENNRLQLKYTRSGSQKKSREMYQSHLFMESDSKKSSAKDIWLAPDHPPDPISHHNASFFQNELHQAQNHFTKELMTLRLEIKINQKEIIDLKQQIEVLQDNENSIFRQFGLTIDDIAKYYRQHHKKQTEPPIKPVKSINKYKEPDPYFLTTHLDHKTNQLDNKTTENLLQKRSMGSFRPAGQKPTPRASSKKEVEINNFVGGSKNKGKNNEK